jgi:enamine deaminase RidA (YjgF/YER057c/UK114 family)
MKNVEERLNELGFSIPEIQSPLANYVPAKRSGNLVFTAGQVCTLGDQVIKGKLGREIDIETGKQATRFCVINCLAAIRQLLGSLNFIEDIVAVHGLINSVPEFTGHADVMNGASDLMVQIFGEQGRHVRTSVGVSSLPHDFTASVYIIVRVNDL